MTVSLEAAVAVEAEFEAEAAVASEAFAPSLPAEVSEQSRTFQVWGGCLRGEAWEAGL